MRQEEEEEDEEGMNGKYTHTNTYIHTYIHPTKKPHTEKHITYKCTIYNRQNSICQECSKANIV